MCCVELGVHIQAFIFSSLDHGRLSEKHISKHSRWRHSQDHGRLTGEPISKHSLFLLTKTLSRSRSVARCAHIQAFAKTLKITVGCPLCTSTRRQTKYQPKVLLKKSPWFVVKTMTVDVFDTLTLSFLLDENILGKWFRSNSSWNERGTFLLQEYFRRGIYFLLQF